MSKIIKHGQDAQKALLIGINFLANTVAATEGPRGLNIILGQRALGQTPKVTRDGVTVANYSDPTDMVEQMGADLVREAAQKTDNAVGDGTTATVVLARELICSGFQDIWRGANPLAIERGIHKAVDAVTSQLRKMAVDVSDEKIFQVATVSAHGEVEIGRLVADAIKKAGRDGVVTAEPSVTSDTYVETVAGLELEKSNLISPVFITHPEEMKAELTDCKILLWEGVIATAKSIVPILQQIKDSGTPVIIIAGGYEAESLSCIIKNKHTLALPLIAIRLEAYGERRKETMRDISALTGTPAYTEDMGLKIDSVKIASLGSARKVVTTMSKTHIIEGRGKQDELAGRVKQIRDAIEAAGPSEKSILQTRLAALLGGITTIKVGGVTVTEMEERRDRVVDALGAAKAAVESGIVPGGGTALLRASEVLLGLKVNAEEQVGVNLVRQACKTIVKQIASNAVHDPEYVLDRLLATPTHGFNALSGEFEDLVDSGIIDPVKVVIEALKNATAVACSILTSAATVAEIPVERTHNG